MIGSKASGVNADPPHQFRTYTAWLRLASERRSKNTSIGSPQRQGRVIEVGFARAIRQSYSTNPKAAASLTIVGRSAIAAVLSASAAAVWPRARLARLRS